jgi:hypothetical protein
VEAMMPVARLRAVEANRGGIDLNAYKAGPMIVVANDFISEIAS